MDPTDVDSDEMDAVHMAAKIMSADEMSVEDMARKDKDHEDMDGTGKDMDAKYMDATGKDMDGKDKDSAGDIDGKGMDGTSKYMDATSKDMDGKDKDSAGDMDGKDMDATSKDMDGKGMDATVKDVDGKYIGAEDIDIVDYMECENIVNKTFRSENEAHKFYLNYAREKGFGIRKGDLKWKGTKQNAYRRMFHCCKQGHRANKHFLRTDAIRKPRNLSRCGCTALLQVELDDRTGVWFVKNFQHKHNHPFTQTELTPYLSSHRRMTLAQKARAVQFSVGAGLRTHQIANVMEHDAGGRGELGFIPRDLYNHVAYEKTKKINGEDARFLLNYLKDEKSKDPDFFYDHKKDSEGHLTHVFWADSQSQMDFFAFGGVLVFDSTYRSNKYKLPFIPFVGLNHHRSTVVYGIGLVSNESTESYEWLLHRFTEAMRQRKPKSVITDGDHAMAKAIESVWLNADHRLCSWHIEENMVTHIKKEKRKEFRELIYRRWDKEEWEKRWVAYKEKYRFRKKTRAWMDRMYELRNKWAKSFTKLRYFLGMQSNQRSESLNSRLHVHLNKRMTLSILTNHVGMCVSNLRKNEQALDAVASHTIPFTKLDAHQLEIHASGVYTPVMFNMVQNNIQYADKLRVAKVESAAGMSSYAICRKVTGNVRFHVTCSFLESKLVSAICGCKKMETEEIPCGHIFCVLKHHNILEIPKFLVMPRWTMKAKLAYPSLRTANTQHWSKHMRTWQKLRNWCDEHLFTAARSDEVIEGVMEYLRSVTDKMENNDEYNVPENQIPKPAFYSSAPQIYTENIKNPIPIVPKGRPSTKESNKRWKPISEKVRDKMKSKNKASAKAKGTKKRKKKHKDSDSDTDSDSNSEEVPAKNKKPQNKYEDGSFTHGTVLTKIFMNFGKKASGKEKGEKGMKKKDKDPDSNTDTDSDSDSDSEDVPAKNKKPQKKASRKEKGAKGMKRKGSEEEVLGKKKPQKNVSSKEITTKRRKRKDSDFEEGAAKKQKTQKKSSGTKEGTDRSKRKYVYSCTDSDTDADTYSDSHSDTESDPDSDLGTDSHSETDLEDVLADKGRMQDGKVPYRKGKTAKKGSGSMVSPIKK